MLIRKLSAVCLCAALTGVSAAAADNEVMFNTGDFSISVDKTITGNSNAVVASLILKSRGEISAQVLPDFIYPYFTDENGRLNVSIPLSDSIQSGKYCFYLHSGEVNDEYSLMIVNPNDSSTAEILEKINKTEDYTEILTMLKNENNAEKIGIDTEDKLLSDNFDYAVRFAVQKRGGSEYSASDFSQAMQLGVICAMINGGADIDEIMKDYAAVFGIGYTDYSGIDEGQRKILDTLLSKADYLKGDPDAVYAEMLDVSKIKTSKTWAYLQENILSFAEKLNIDVSASSVYQSIKESNRYKVFQNMMNNLSSYDSYSAVKNDFDKQAQAVKKSEGSSNGGGSSSSGSGSTSGGGSSSGGSAGAGTQVVALGTQTETNKDKETNAGRFSDTENHWAREYINALADKNAVSGYSDNSFKPDNYVTRAEFIKMAVELFDINGETDEVFSDVAEDAWYKPYVGRAVGAGAVKGYNGSFKPDEYITRQDAAVILDRILGGAGDAAAVTFEDAAEISGYAAEAVGRLCAEGILQGYDNKFNPRADITRGETAAMLYKAEKQR